MRPPGGLTIWGYALGYFLCYAPYSALASALSRGALPWPFQGVRITGFALLPVTAMASLCGVLVFITAMGWWRYAGHRRILGVSLPVPGPWTFLSGLSSAVIIGTTTLAYSLGEASILFMALLMRGGVLILAPLVDGLTGRKVTARSWAALVLSLVAVVCASLDGIVEMVRPGLGTALTLGPTSSVVLAVYLLGYFVRLRFMSRLAKSPDPLANVRYFVEEQLVATPAMVLGLLGLALVGAVSGGEGVIPTILAELRSGFTDVLRGPALPVGVVIGLLSQGAGVCGGLVLLDRRENSFCVPVNRASSVLAGLCASYGLWLFVGFAAPSSNELLGAVLIVIAIAMLTLPARPRAAVAPVAR